jgi:DNA-binding MarR family transcriptional regulator
LEELKLIKRVVSAEDKRKMVISLTVHGTRVVEKTRYERDEWLAQAIGERLGEKELKTLAAVIPLLQRIADT